MTTRNGRPSTAIAPLLALVACAWLLAGSHDSAQSLSYSRGQNVSPAFEGWETADDGISSFLFGYMNANWDEEVDVPVGPANNFDLLGGPDLGQPTHFLPRRNRFVFKVAVPKDFGSKELIWTLTSHGITEKAYASLRQDYFVDNVVIASETGALGPGSSNPAMRANKAPVVVIDGGKSRSAKVGQPISLTATVTDDGVPDAPAPSPAAIARRTMMPPQRITVGKSLGLHLSWFVYRGAGQVTFDPVQVKPWEDTRAGANSPWAPLWVAPPRPADHKWVAQAQFDRPGTYLLRARADDGGLLTDAELTVIVSP